MNTKYDLMIIGATFAGLGAAYGAGQNCIVTDRTALVGHEFINCYHPGTDWQHSIGRSLSPYGNNLKQELMERKILSEEGRVYLPAIAPVLYNRIEKDALPVLLLTEIVDIKKKEDGFKVTLYNNSGLSFVNTQRIMLTSVSQRYASCMQLPRQPRSLSKSINSAIAGEPAKHPYNWSSERDLSFVEGKLNGEFYLKLQVPADETWISARKRLHQIWTERPTDMRHWTLAAVAEDFEMQIEPEIISDEYGIFCPSTAFKNPLEAFEAGVEQVKEGIK